ncbi:Outer membrane protein (porin) [Roseovarius azorensis]|uniref:Outer membrane protein (Porin) n=1 Tax=Roseovarius azorensis TaxID=1287727 RepID=A0A1H7G359_9RHOB|nr:porin [Roseovarius azorensis]SEK30125.1 Outer membrane protein (porin) [Roseovarius azorensis]
MKKQLLSTSAIAIGVVAMGAPALAQDWDMTWGGYHTSHVGLVDVSTNTAAHAGADFDGVDVYTEAEIHFTPSITLDNGMTFGVTVEYESTTNGGGTVDESYMTISSDTLGRIVLGNANSVGYNMMVSAPQLDGSIWINSPSLSGFIPISISAGGNLPWNFRQAGISAYTEVLGNDDVARISYYTPSFNGLTLGVSYAAADNILGGGVNAGNNFGVNRNAGVNDIFDIAVAYSQSFNGVDINAAARWGTASNDTGIAGTSDPEVWNIGATIGVAGFTFGGSYQENDNGNLIPDEEGWALGATYDIPGPWSIGIDTYQGEMKGTGAGAGDKAEYEAYQIIGNREIGPGVSWSIYAVHAEGSVNADAGGTFGNPNTSVEGTLIGTSVNLSF